jgi:phosphatidylserine decarboxylase
MKLLNWLGSILQFLMRIFTKPKNDMTRRQAWFIWWQHHIPQLVLSRTAGFVANLQHPLWLKNGLIQQCIKRYNIDLSEAVEPNPTAYPSFNAFFTRRLQTSKRPIAEQGIVSPADAEITEIGYLNSESLIQAKQKSYRLLDLLGGRDTWLNSFCDGAFATFYLSPKDYHRVHMPADGKLIEMIHVPGRLFSVNKTMVDHQPDLFARNERVINIFETAHGPMAVILVGAMLVASINTVWCGEVTPPSTYDVTSWPLVSLTLQTFLIAEFGFLGVVV